MKKDTNQTAVKFLFEMYHKQNGTLYAEHFNHSLQLEKQQIMESFRYGHIDGFTSANYLETEFKNEEQYYNQTYNK